MYNDGRAVQEAEAINQVSQAFQTRLGYAFNASFALAKMLWLKQQRPKIFASTSLFVHATDFIIGKLSGTYHLSDYSNALKSGYDLERYEWPAFIEHELGIPLEKLPQIVHPGTPITTVSGECAAETGLAANTPVVAGMTDGCTSQIASGAVKPGDWNSTLGTTLVIKA
jgi:xylulokinase